MFLSDFGVLYTFNEIVMWNDADGLFDSFKKLLNSYTVMLQVQW